MARDIDSLIAQLTLDEKASLTAGEDSWSTHAIERVGIPKVLVTDGPNGARGTFLPDDRENQASFCSPCGSALGSSWNVALVEELGVLLGQETRAKSCHVLLAPTVNIPRSPLAGRNFECYSEDPLLSGAIAAAYVRGVQSQGVATTVKHFAGNDAEFQRMTINSVIDERTLREITLLPFEIAVRAGGSLGIMTSYNRLNGSYCTEDAELLTGILRDEWGFEGFVITDWFGRGSTVGAAGAGLDLEMPGPHRIYGPALADAVRDGSVPEEQLDSAVRHLLTVFDRIGALDKRPKPPPSRDTAESRDLARRLATESMVLFKNDDAVLPLDAGSLRSIAVIGPNAENARIMGGGSAEVRPHYQRTPLEALRDRLGDRVTIVHEPGSDIDRTVPAVPAERLAAPGGDGRGGFAIDVFAGLEWAGEPIAQHARRDGTLVFQAGLGQRMPEGPFSFRATATLTPEHDGPHVLSMIQVGEARLLVDDDVVLDGISEPPPLGVEYFGSGSVQMDAVIDLVAGRATKLVLEFRRADRGWMHGARVGFKRVPPEDLLERAVEAARAADVALVVVGTNNDWESEGHDRTSLDLPGNQAELIARVCEANPRTIVVTNTGAPVTMAWADGVPAILQTWFGGQEMADALVDVLLGDSEPSGRLAVTYPEHIEHTPAFGNFPGEHGQVRYGEGVLVGYRWYEARLLPTRYPFGHGLGYTSFVIDTVRTPDAFDAGDESATLTVDVDVTNTGLRAGSEVVQCYVGAPAGQVVRPPKELKAFAKVHLEPGETTTVRLVLDRRSFAYWRPEPDVPTTTWVQPPTASMTVPAALPPGWTVEPGWYTLFIGRSSADIALVIGLNVTA